MYEEDEGSEHEPAALPVEAGRAAAHLADVVAHAPHAVHMRERDALEQSEQNDRYVERVPVDDLPVEDARLRTARLVRVLYSIYVALRPTAGPVGHFRSGPVAANSERRGEDIPEW